MLRQSNNRKEQESRKLAADVEAFLASGGCITLVPIAPQEPKKRDKRMTVKRGWDSGFDGLTTEKKVKK